MSYLKFKATRAEFETIRKIAERAHRAAIRSGVEYTVLDAHMDVEACHCNSNPLRLEELLTADDVHFNHDVFGIRRYLDRDSGKLTDHFTPRHTQSSVVTS